MLINLQLIFSKAFKSRSFTQRKKGSDRKPQPEPFFELDERGLLYFIKN